MSESVIDRVFQRLAATYGAAWDRSLGSAPMADVKAVWRAELIGFANHLHALEWALAHLPERVPNVIEFLAICRGAPDTPQPQLPPPAANPEQVARVMAKLSRPVAPPDPLDWARRIMARHDAGEKLSPTVLRFAREALASAARRQFSVEAA